MLFRSDPAGRRKGNTMAHRSPGRRLREAVADVTIQIPGAFNALVGPDGRGGRVSTRSICREPRSRPARWPCPTSGLFSLTELATQAAYLTRRVRDSRDRRRRHRLRRAGERRADRSRTRSGRRRRHSAGRSGTAQAVRASVGQAAGRAGRNVRQAARGRGRPPAIPTW